MQNPNVNQNDLQILKFDIPDLIDDRINILDNHFNNSNDLIEDNISYVLSWIILQYSYTFNKINKSRKKIVEKLLNRYKPNPSALTEPINILNKALQLYSKALDNKIEGHTLIFSYKDMEDILTHLTEISGVFEKYLNLLNQKTKERDLFS